jgi:DNA-binding NtrC family response regulator
MGCEQKWVLVVDDEPAPCRELKRCFEIADSPEYTFTVTCVMSLQEYYEAVKRREYDILVVDIRLASGDEEGIDNVVAFHKVRWPASIVIVYSAFPQLEPIPTCVRVMRLGASDCIAKGSDDSVRKVVLAAIRELTTRKAPEPGPTSDWLASHIDDLVNAYGGKAVAFVGEEVVDVADSARELRDRAVGGRYGAAPYIMVIPPQGGHE